MRMMKYTAFAAAFALSGCIDVDLTATITGAETASMSGTMEVETQMLAMMGGELAFCNPDEGGTLVMTDTTAQCNILIEGKFGEVFVPTPGEPTPTATDLGDGTVRVEFPLGAMTAEAGNMRDDPQTAQMMRPMLDGHTFTVRIAGEEIVSTNGTISDDGQSAAYTFPLVEILNAEFEIPAVFEAVVRY